MPVAELDGIEIAYELVGEGQPWVLTPGGRFTKEVGGLPEMARALADRGQQVLTWDRPNCGASSVVFRGASESEVQAEALGALLRHLDLGPTVIAGGSGGARVSLLAAARNPDVTAGLGDVVDQRRRSRAAPAGQLLLHAVGRRRVARRDGRRRRARPVAGGARSATRGTGSASSRWTARSSSTVMDRWMLAYCPCDDSLVPGLDDDDVARLRRPDPRVPQRRVRHVAHPRHVRSARRGPAGRRAGRAAVGRQRVERAASRGRAGRVALRPLAAARPPARRLGRPDDRLTTENDHDHDDDRAADPRRPLVRRPRRRRHPRRPRRRRTCARSINELFEEHGLLIFEDVEPTPQMQVAFSTVFGPLKDHPSQAAPRAGGDDMLGVIEMRHEPNEPGTVLRRRSGCSRSGCRGTSTTATTTSSTAPVCCARSRSRPTAG